MKLLSLVSLSFLSPLAIHAGAAEKLAECPARIEAVAVTASHQVRVTDLALGHENRISVLFEANAKFYALDISLSGKFKGALTHLRAPFRYTEISSEKLLMERSSLALSESILVPVVHMM